MELKTQKCNRCKTLRKPSQFIFNEKEHKCCVVCSEKSKKYNVPIYQFIPENGGWDEWKMIPIEVFPCNSKTNFNKQSRFPSIGKVFLGTLGLAH